MSKLKIIKLVTLIVPLPVYLFLMATLFSITPDYIINTEIERVSVVDYDEAYFIYTDDLEASLSGLMIYNAELQVYGIVIDEEDIIKIDGNYYSYILNNQNVRELVNIQKFAIQKQQSYKIPVSVFLSLIGILMVVLIVTKKLKWHEDHPKGAVFIALFSATVVLYIVNTIIGGILGVFIVATISWGLYLIEDMVDKGLLTTKQAEKVESDLLKALKEASAKLGA
jgi:hypothetical protein